MITCGYRNGSYILPLQGNTLINKLTFDLPYNLQEKPDVRYFYLTSELGWSKCAEER